MAERRADPIRRLDAEAGFSMIEVVIAVLVLVLGSLATFGILRAATTNAQRAKGTQVALDRAQQEMEALRSLSNSELALTELPPASTDRLSPDYRVNHGNRTFALTREPSEEASPPELVVNNGWLYGGGFVEGGVVVPEEEFSSGDVKGTVYRYIVWRNDDGCGANCPGEQDYKQIVVAVKLAQLGNEAAEHGYVEVQSDFIDPTDSAASDPIPPAGGSVNSPQQLYLSDTPCSSDGSTEEAEWPQREATGDHSLHNTLGTCASGLQEGPEVGAPDGLLLSSAPDPAPTDPSSPPVLDYSDDYPGQLAPEAAKGIQLIPDATGGCHLEPTNASESQWEVHRWVTDPMQSKFILNGKATIDFFTRSFNGLSYSGSLCIYLARVEEFEQAGEVRFAYNPLSNTATGKSYWTYSGQDNGEWPRSEWAEVRVPMSFATTEIKAGERLGVALSVDGNSDSGAIPVLYDHPDYRARIEIESPTPLSAG